MANMSQHKAAVPEPPHPSPRPLAHISITANGSHQPETHHPAPAQPPSKLRRMSTTIHDPMEEQAAYNQLVDETSLKAKDSPIYGITEPSLALPVRESSYSLTSPSDITPDQASSENHASDAGDISSSQPPQKRQPRKLTKARGNSVNSQSNGEKTPTAERTSGDRPRGVLTKKGSRQSTASFVEDGQKTENTPPPKGG